MLVPLRNVGRFRGPGSSSRHQKVGFFFCFLNEEVPKNTMFFLGFNQLKGGGLGPVFFCFGFGPTSIFVEKNERR